MCIHVYTSESIPTSLVVCLFVFGFVLCTSFTCLFTGIILSFAFVALIPLNPSLQTFGNFASLPGKNN